MLSNAQLFNTTLKAAKTAGGLVKKNFNKTKIVSKKNGAEIVTTVDIACEKLIKKIIQKKYPNHNFITEELTNQKTASDYIWYIDPIDGTVNFSRNIPHIAVSIALTYKNSLIIGVVFDPIKNELFTAQKGKSAYLNDKKIKVSKIRLLENSILATGFAYDRRANFDNNTKQIGAFVPLVSGIRRYGVASLDLCYVATGRFDGYWERNIKSWDVAAGILILQEAGGKVTDYRNNKINLEDVKNIIASNGKIQEKIYKVIKKSYKKFI